MRILVTGATGQLAKALAEAAVGASGVSVVTMGRPGLDLARPETIEAALEMVAPDLVINTAAYTAVDKAESEPDLAFSVNATGAGLLAQRCQARALPIIHVSTDYVFAGDGARAYREADPTSPSNVYGRSKLEGERLVAAAAARHVIVRTAWVHSPWGHNFVKTMLRVGGTQRELKVVADQHGCPTYAPHLAAACLAIARRVAGEPERSAVWGPCHVAGHGDTTWHGFAKEIFAVAEARGAPPVTVIAIPTTDYPTPAKRPTNSRLDCDRLNDVFGVRMPPWTDGAQACVHRLLSAAAEPAKS
jgi:dTDP-4-dehydrorhamnose reductase